MSSRSSSVTALVSLRKELARATLDAMWAQWRAIGASAKGGARSAAAIVDPEALVLASLFFEDEEPRLRDVLYAWIERNASLLSVGRLRALTRHYPSSVNDRLREFASVAAKLAKHPRWTTLSSARSETESPIDQFSVPRATQAALGAPPALMLRMRAALGVGVKADALTYLLGQADRQGSDPTTVRAVANALRYTLVATRSALGDLTAARFIIASAERPLSFAAPRRGWHDLLGLATLPPWRPWHPIYGFVCSFLDWSNSVRGRNASDAVVRIHQRELLDMHPAVRQIVSAHETSSFVRYSSEGVSPVEVLTSYLGAEGAL